MGESSPDHHFYALLDGVQEPEQACRLPACLCSSTVASPRDSSGMLPAGDFWNLR